MLRWGKGSVVQTWTGARGAPRTPRSNLRSDFLLAEEEELEEDEDETEGALANWPFIQWPHLPSPLLPTSSPSVPSGPSFNGDKASTGLKLPDLVINNSGGTPWFFLRRRRSPDIGEALLAGDFARDLAGESPLTTSSLRDEKKPCFRSILQLCHCECVKSKIVIVLLVGVVFFGWNGNWYVRMKR